MLFGERLRILREELGLSQKELGNKVGLERATISKYETQTEPLETYKTLVILSEIFDVPTDYLLGLTDCRERYSVAVMPVDVNIDDIVSELPPESQKAIVEYANVLLKKHNKGDKDEGKS